MLPLRQAGTSLSLLQPSPCRALPTAPHFSKLSCAPGRDPYLLLPPSPLGTAGPCTGVGCARVGPLFSGGLGSTVQPCSLTWLSPREEGACCRASPTEWGHTLKLQPLSPRPLLMTSSYHGITVTTTSPSSRHHHIMVSSSSPRHRHQDVTDTTISSSQRRHHQHGIIIIATWHRGTHDITVTMTSLST